MPESSNEEPGSLSAAVTGCVIALDRCTFLLQAIPDESYAAMPEGHSSIGAHLRHGLEHFNCLLCGLEEGMVDYDARVRDRGIESDRNAACDLVARTRETLTTLDPAKLPSRLFVRQIAAPGLAPIVVETTLARELVFLAQHMIHHIALMLTVAAHLHTPLPDDLGLAFSTECHRQMLPPREA